MDQILKNWLLEHNINYILHRHPPVYTVEEARLHCSHIAGLHCKNLFLKDSNTKRFYLITVPAAKKVEISDLPNQIGVAEITLLVF